MSIEVCSVTSIGPSTITIHSSIITIHSSFIFIEFSIITWSSTIFVTLPTAHNARLVAGFTK